MKFSTQWKEFKEGDWQTEVNVRDFIIKNYTPYFGDESFLQKPTKATLELWDKAKALIDKEAEKGILDVETKVPSSIITSYGPGYLDKDLETIVGLQTDAPLKRAIMPFGGYRNVESALAGYGYKLDPETSTIFEQYRKTHSQAVFDVYTKEMLKVRESGIITGLPDTYSRGRIIGDYRRVALYGTNFLLERKVEEKEQFSGEMDVDSMRLREELSEQLTALEDLTEMAESYGFDISVPAKNAREAIQWTYFAFLGAVKQQDGAAMGLGRVATFLDIYIERDLRNGIITEKQAQEYIDHFVMKLRLVRFLRTSEHRILFSGDPIWITESIGGQGIDGQTLVTKNSYRMLHTLYNLGSAPEPNITVLWSVDLPQTFKEYCAKVSIDTSAIQYENDDLMRSYWGDDYGIASCVSAMIIGKQMQFFGARANLAKALLYAINGGVDEITGEQITPVFEPIKSEYLDYYEVLQRYDYVTDWLAKMYIKILNVIHFMHDKYNYESLQMSLHDVNALRCQSTGIAGFSVVVDSLSAIKHAIVKVIRNDAGIAVGYEIEGQYPAFGNNDQESNQIAKKIIDDFAKKLNSQKPYRDAKITMSILTTTSNITYGKKTGATPCGRKAGEPFAPGANPMHGRDKNGAIAVLSSVSKLPYEHLQDGISFTFSVSPRALGKTKTTKAINIVNILDSYFFDNGHHININVLERDILLDAIVNPHRYPQLTVRVSGYAVNFIRLSKEQQLEIVSRTIHDSI
ncbi:MAG: formate C-acetyltransferase [Defluviitaleaceae bacterium]|nr:formate C-acetyltransferase [Defluviitaleaceae bacterium]